MGYGVRTVNVGDAFTIRVGYTQLVLTVRSKRVILPLIHPDLGVFAA